jgi:pyruvate/2-oxoglutarate dehydrogenase complex dihydrolipoamide acyltransferase (E2) component
METFNGVKPSYTALVIRAVALALQRHPYANRLPFRRPFWKRLVQLNRVDVAVAVEKDEPGFEQVAYAEILRDAADKDLVQITAELQKVVRTKAENSPTWRIFRRLVEKLPSSLAVWLLSLPRFSPAMWIKYRGGAVLISSPSKYGVDAVLGHWVWPLGFSFGLVKERPVVIDGKVCVRPTMTLTMSFNRLVMGGAPAARFFHEVTRILENVETEFGLARSSTAPKNFVAAPAFACTNKAR